MPILSASFSGPLHLRNTPSHEVTDPLGGLKSETLGLLGSNLDIANAVTVAKANELCNNFRLDTIFTGGIIAYPFECVEKVLLR